MTDDHSYHMQPSPKRELLILEAMQVLTNDLLLRHDLPKEVPCKDIIYTLMHEKILAIDRNVNALHDALTLIPKTMTTTGR